MAAVTSPRLTHPAHLDHLRHETSRLREVLAHADPAAPVPACPAWTAADLLWHLGGEVQHQWAWVVEHRPRDPGAGYAPPTRPDSVAGLLDVLDDASARLVAALRDGDPAEPAWTWADDEADRTLGFIARRQALEAQVHRLDAEQVVGDVRPLDPALSADGVEEVLAVMYGGCPPWGRFEPGPTWVRWDLTDTGDELWTRLGLFGGTSPDGTRTYADEDDLALSEEPGPAASLVVSGTAAGLQAWLWHRADDAGVTVSGDEDAYARLAGILRQPID